MKQCEWCGKDYPRDSRISNAKWAKQKFCSKRCGLFSRRGEKHPNNRGEKHPNWKGGRTKNPRGYIAVRRPEHPYCQSHGYILEHRLVMEKHLGRYLHPKEVIHHINGNREDNRIENLQLMKDSSEHSKHHFRQDIITGRLVR